jgi:hypothetical protein
MQTNTKLTEQPDQPEIAERIIKEQNKAPAILQEKETGQKDIIDELAKETTRNRPPTGQKNRKTPPKQEHPSTTEDDGKWETMDTDPQKLKQEGNGEEIHQHPKRQKKMKPEKQLTPIAELTTIMTRKITNKTGKS